MGSDPPPSSLIRSMKSTHEHEHEGIPGRGKQGSRTTRGGPPPSKFNLSSPRHVKRAVDPGGKCLSAHGRLVGGKSPDTTVRPPPRLLRHDAVRGRHRQRRSGSCGAPPPRDRSRGGGGVAGEGAEEVDGVTDGLPSLPFAATSSRPVEPPEAGAAPSNRNRSQDRRKSWSKGAPVGMTRRPVGRRSSNSLGVAPSSAPGYPAPPPPEKRGTPRTTASKSNKKRSETTKKHSVHDANGIASPMRRPKPAATVRPPPPPRESPRPTQFSPMPPRSTKSASSAAARLTSSRFPPPPFAAPSDHANAEKASAPQPQPPARLRRAVSSVPAFRPGRTRAYPPPPPPRASGTRSRDNGAADEDCGSNDPGAPGTSSYFTQSTPDMFGHAPGISVPFATVEDRPRESPLTRGARGRPRRRSVEASIPAPVTTPEGEPRESPFASVPGRLPRGRSGHVRKGRANPSPEPRLSKSTDTDLQQGNLPVSRRDYRLGEAARCLSHMIVEPNPRRATMAISSLSDHDYAFVKCADGSFAYSLLAYRSAAEDDSSEERMTFVLSDSVTTKTIGRRHWATSVRLTSTGVFPRRRDATSPAEPAKSPPRQERTGPGGGRPGGRSRSSNGLRDYDGKPKGGRSQSSNGLRDCDDKSNPLGRSRSRDGVGDYDDKSNPLTEGRSSFHSRRSRASPRQNQQQQPDAKSNRSSSNTLRSKSPSQQNQQQQQSHPFGFREDYALGQTARSPLHMIVEPTPEKATEAVNSLSKHDFAFVKRSDGLFTYAVLAFRSDEDAGPACLDSWRESMTFVLSKSGCTKMLKKSQWSQFVRLVSADDVHVEEDPPAHIVMPNGAPSTRQEEDQQSHKIDGKHVNNNQEVKSKDEQNANNDLAKNPDQDYLNRLRTEFYSTRRPASAVPPSEISFDAAEDDLISCVSGHDGFRSEPPDTTKYAPSQPIILE